MVAKKKSTKRKSGKVQVTFTMPAIDNCDCLYLVGDFNDWNETAHPMQSNEDGTWSLTLDLEPSREYQYRFRTNDGTWWNDPDAPRAPNPFGSENSILST